MRKINRIIMILVSVLLSLVLITSSVLSGTFAKYVTGEKSASSNTGRVAKWGITVTSGTHLNTKYSEMGDGAFKVHTTGATKMLAPGTRGSLAWFRVSGNPEVAYDIDFTGDISIGSGYQSIPLSDGTTMTYFPIIIYLVAYDVQEDGSLSPTSSLNTNSYKIDFTITHKINASSGNNYASVDTNLDLGTCCRTYGFTNLDSVANVMNGTYRNSKTGATYPEVNLDNVFDQTNFAPNHEIDRIYAVEWCWPYNSESSYPKDHHKGVRAYQTREKDTLLAEAIAADPTSDDFNITVNMSAAVTQIKNYSTSYTFTDDGKVLFGSYPQTDVTESMEKTLNDIAGTNYSTWTSYGYTSGNMRYTDVTLDNGEKYRGVYFTEARNNPQSENGYLPNQAYWFKYEPIKWTIFDRDMSEGKILIFCDLAIDSQQFQSGDVPSGLYKNNYEYSTIRTWLNETFYNTAFNDLQKQVIITTEVVNDAASADLSDNTYVCANTNDNVFLLSYAEAGKYFPGEESTRKKYPTDYALAQGVYKYRGAIEWWLRSPNRNESEIEVRAVAYTGNRTYRNPPGSSDMGVLPALWIKL